MDPILIARIAHEADRAFLATQGELTQKVWPALEAWERESAVRGVKQAIANRDLDARQLHELWRRDKGDAGWIRAERFDLSAKRDPLLVPWTELPQRAQRRDAMFVAIARALSPEI